MLVIDLNPREQECHVCRAVVPVGFGLPVDESGLIVPNWYEGEWAGVPACEPCYRRHKKWSEETANRQPQEGRK